MDRILVMRGGALGDFVLGLPALRALRGAFPRASLELIAPSAVLPLASALADAVTPLERAEVAALFGDAGSLPEGIVARHRGLDLVALWLADLDGSVRRNFEVLGARRLLWSPALPPPGRHAADHLLATLEPLGLLAPSVTASSPRRLGVPVVRPSAAAKQNAFALWRDLGLSAGRPVVAVHPGSGGDWKRWPAERFAQVADRLAEEGVGVVVIQGPADAEVVGQLLARVRGRRPPVVSGLGVEDLAAFLSLAACYLGNDSGVTHLAAAVGTPTVAIFGPTDPGQWGPRGPNVLVLRAERECVPCGREGGARCRDRACLELVSVEQVVEAMRACAGQGRPVGYSLGQEPNTFTVEPCCSSRSSADFTFGSAAWPSSSMKKR